MLDTTGLRGITHIDAARRRVTALPGTTVGEFGEPLWDAGLALANQGDIDTQAIAGAIATGTHGSGNALPSFSATLRACRLVDGHGEVVEIDETTPGAAARRAGRGRDARRDDEPHARGRRRPTACASASSTGRFADVLERWDELFAAHRHFSFFWLPSEGSARALRPRHAARRAA